MIRTCKTCKDEYNTFSNLQTRCPKCQYKRDDKKKQASITKEHPAKIRKPIAKKGKRTLQYEKWRDTIAKPHLIRVYGHQCAWCGRTKQHLDMLGTSLDVDHIKTRGAHPELRMDIKNVRFLCRDCHSTRE